MGKMKGSREQPLPLEAGKRLETRRFFQLRRPRVETAAGRPKTAEHPARVVAATTAGNLGRWDRAGKGNPRGFDRG